MYEEYWGLREKPFENTADPRFLYASPQHEEALTRLGYAINPAAVTKMFPMELIISVFFLLCCSFLSPNPRWRTW